MPTRARSSSEPAIAQDVVRDFAMRLIDWQRGAGRHDLPWQKTHDPYRIWLSEVMLQQTRVSAVLPYYQRFLADFPDVAALAAATSDEVMSHWAGLGYYSRARHLHLCAQRIVHTHGGRFPTTAAELMTLPGVGRSTAAAIAAFAFGERAAILDGNVKRVLCRVFGIARPMEKPSTERELVRFATDLLPDVEIAAYTQGLMDLGATVCTAPRPACEFCPFRSDCIARKTGAIELLPTPKVRRATPLRRASMVLARQGDAIWLERRPERGIWGGLWCLPCTVLDGSADDDGSAFVNQVFATAGAPVHEFARLEHAFTHFRLLARVWSVTTDASAAAIGDGRWIGPSERNAIGLPAPIKSLFTLLSGDLLHDSPAARIRS